MAGNATRTAAESLKDRATELAALRWNCDAKDLSYDDGAVQRDSDRLTLQELAAFAETRGETLSADALFDNEKKMSYSYGAHAAQIAIDIATGVVEVERYWLTEEIGRALNPAMVQGQAVGGVMQGLGGTFLDHFVYDEDGQLLTGSFADYLLPTTSELPDIWLSRLKIRRPNSTRWVSRVPAKAGLSPLQAPSETRCPSVEAVWCINQRAAANARPSA